MQKRLLIILFFVVIWLPFFQMELKIFPSLNNTEKRTLRTFPKTHSVGKWINDFDGYFNDNFGFRNVMTMAHSFISVKIFGVSAVLIVLIGKDGWLFYKSEATGDGPGINDYQGLTPFTETELKGVKSNIENIKEQLAYKNIMLLILVAPNKSTIYSQYLPNSIKKVNNITRFDQLANYSIDTRNLLKNPPLSYPTYYKTDTHWNNYGAFLVSQVLVGEIKKFYPEVESLNFSDYSVNVIKNFGDGDIATMLNLNGQFRDEIINIVPNKVYFHKTPKILFFGDSYSPSVKKILDDRFTDIVLAGLGPSYKFRMDLVDQEKPDIVIWEVAERFIDRLRL